MGRPQDKTGIDYDGRITSLLQVAFDEADLLGLEETIEVFSRTDGFDAHRLDSGEVSDLEPRIGPGVVGGVYARGNAALDSYKYTLALGQAAEQMGAGVRLGTVRLLERDHGRVTGVVLNDGVISCGQVVLAMGPWSRQAERWLDTYIPVDPLKGEILRLQLSGPALPHDIPAAEVPCTPSPTALCGAVRPRNGAASTKRPVSQPVYPSWERATRAHTGRGGCPHCPTNGLLASRHPDWLPCIGKLPEWENVCLATGAGKKGVLLSPGIGKAVADLMVDGETGLSIDGFSPSRFDPMPA